VANYLKLVDPFYLCAIQLLRQYTFQRQLLNESSGKIHSRYFLFCLLMYEKD